MIAIVVPVYNAKKYITQCVRLIESILKTARGKKT